jgi:hypothetical protein
MILVSSSGARQIPAEPTGARGVTRAAKVGAAVDLDDTIGLIPSDRFNAVIVRPVKREMTTPGRRTRQPLSRICGPERAGAGRSPPGRSMRWYCSPKGRRSVHAGSIFS